MKPEEFWKRVDKTGDCWLWTGYLPWHGYGIVQVSLPLVPILGYRGTTAHRWAYMLEVGPIPEGYQLDHLCRVRHCVRPSHLEAVTPQENVRRAQSSVCSKGHDLNDPKHGVPRKGGWRLCRTCKSDWQRARRAALREQRAA